MRLIIIFIMMFSYSANANELESIIYTSWGQLCSISPTANKSSCISSTQEFDNPSWQPNGDKIIASTGSHDATHYLVLLQADGTVIKRIKNSEDFFRPVWSTDGKYIYALNYDLKHFIGRWKEDGSQFIKVPIRGFDDRYDYLQMIAFSPSGKRASILTDKFEKMLIIEISNNEMVATKMLPAQFDYVSQSVWRNDTELLFIGKKNSTQGGLWELNTLSDAVRKVGVPELWLRDSIAISPDKKSVVFCATPGGKITKWGLWEYSLTTNKFRQITAGSEDVNPSWR